MTESNIQGMKILLEEVIGKLDVFLAQVRELDVRDKQLDRKRDTISQKETKVLKDLVAIRDQTNDMDSKIKEVKDTGEKTNRIIQELRIQEGRIEQQREGLKKEKITLDEKITAVEDIEKREKGIKIKEQEIKDKLDDISSKQANITKEQSIARERKEMLDKRESKLSEDKAKIQKYLDI